MTPGPTDLSLVASAPAGAKVFAIVPAAGYGSRMGHATPKQYLKVQGKTILEHTLERLLSVSSITSVTVALSTDDDEFAQLPIASHPKVVTTIGGNERSDSVLAALKSLSSEAKSHDWAMVHDAARCCIRAQTIERLLRSLADDDVGGILAVPASDTLKQVAADKTVQFTLDRSVVWQAQTPQLFRYELLCNALHKALDNDLLITDEASAMELAGYDPLVVMGNYDNIKITHPEDLAIAEVLLAATSTLPE